MRSGACVSWIYPGAAAAEEKSHPARVKPARSGTHLFCVFESGRDETPPAVEEKQAESSLSPPPLLESEQFVPPPSTHTQTNRQAPSSSLQRPGTAGHGSGEPCSAFLEVSSTSLHLLERSAESLGSAQRPVPVSSNRRSSSASLLLLQPELMGEKRGLDVEFRPAGRVRSLGARGYGAGSLG